VHAEGEGFFACAYFSYDCEVVFLVEQNGYALAKDSVVVDE
jgi:hypothetical protein